MDTRGRSWVLRVGYIAVTAGLVLTIAGAVAFVVISLVPGGERSIGTTVTIPSDLLDDLPTGVELAERTRVTLRIEDPTPGQEALVLVPVGLWIGFTVAVLAVVRRILGSVRHGDPFTAANVRRLRSIGLALLVGVPLFLFVTGFFIRALAEASSVTDIGLPFGVPWTPMLAGLGVLILAQVFAHGVQLREDVEGTV